MYDKEILTQLIAYNKQRRYAFNNSLTFEKNSDFEKMLNSRSHKVNRIKRRVLYLFNRYNYIWFCTFTINNDFINKSERTKRDYIKQYLNTHDFKYILNVDFGKSNTERQHYHCILATNINMDVNQYFQDRLNTSYGWTKSLLCRRSSDSLSKVAKYIDKLSLHCVKATTENRRLFANFKAYESFCPTPSDCTKQYDLERWYLEQICPPT